MKYRGSFIIPLLIPVFITLSSGPFALGTTEAASTETPSSEVHDCELVIAEASLGGVAAALQAVRLGTKTCLTSMTDWVGGQLTVQAVAAIDGPYHFFFSGADKEFLTRFGTQKGDRWLVEKNGYIGGGTYTQRPHTDEVERTMEIWKSRISSRGDCWVSLNCFPPSEADQALKAILQPYIEQGLLKIFYETVPKRVQMTNGRITSVDFVQRTYTGEGPAPYAVRLSQEIEDWYDKKASPRYNKKIIRLSGDIFIDGTETGELVVLSGASHRLGYEGKGNEGPKGNPESECVMGFTYPLNLAEKKPTEEELAPLRSISGPEGEEPFDITQGGKFKFWPDDPTQVPFDLSVFGYRRISDSPSVTMMNWADGGNDYSGMNFIVPVEKLSLQLEDWKGGIRTDALDAAERHAWAFALWLNEQDSVTMKSKGLDRGVTPIWDLNAPNNFFGTGTALSKFPYVRETRRIEGYGGFFVDADDVTTDTAALGDFNGPEYSHFNDSIGIGAYPIDIRSCPTGRTVSYPRKRSNHYQVPLRALVSANIRNLMVANKTWAVDQISNAAYRLHPTEWNAGFGAGTAAAVAIRHRLTSHQLMQDRSKIDETQREVIRSGGRVLWFSDQIPSDLNQNTETHQ